MKKIHVLYQDLAVVGQVRTRGYCKCGEWLGGYNVEFRTVIGNERVTYAT